MLFIYVVALHILEKMAYETKTTPFRSAPRIHGVEGLFISCFFPQITLKLRKQCTRAYGTNITASYLEMGSKLLNNDVRHSTSPDFLLP